jgi:hypothetical protein
MKRALLAALFSLPLTVPAQMTSTSLSLGVGFMTFGTRLERPDASFEYANSVAFDLRFEKSLTRRIGVMAAGFAAPFSGQRATIGDVGVFDDVSVFGGELALSFRFKPAAPIYFFGGGIFKHFSDYSDPRETGGANNEPGGVLGVGYDRRSSGRVNFRVQLAVHLMKPADGKQWQGEQGVIDSPNTAKSLTQDWTFGIALRRSSASQ